MKDSFHTKKPPEKHSLLSTLALALITILTLALIPGASGQTVTILTVQVSTSPVTVGASAKVTFQAKLQSGSYYQNGDTLTFNVPNPGSFTSGSGASLCVPNTGTSNIGVSACTISSNTVTMTLSVTSSYSNFQVTVSNFKNPNSDSQINGITCTLSNSAGSTRGTFSTAVLSNLQADKMLAASITPGSTQIGAIGQTVTISLTPKNYLRTNGKIQVYFPPWNPSDQRPDHMIQSLTPNCVSVSGMSSYMQCTYNQDTRKLTVTSPVTADVTQTAISFSVDNFKNPYNGKVNSGYYVQIQDSSGGNIDSSQIAGITMSIQMTQWATFSQILMGRDDSVTQVGELSIGNIFFSLDFPVDAYCRITVVFPTDMPLTSDLTQLQSSGIMSGTKTTFTKNAATNTISVDGCSLYSQQAAATLSLSLYYMLNKGYVQDTQTFQVTLEALDAIGGTVTYPIARQQSGLTLDTTDFTVGTIASFAVTAASGGTSEIQQFTQYQVSLKPSHSIPSSSVITVKFPSSITLVSSSSCTLVNPVSPMSSSATCSVASNTVTISHPFGPSGSYTKGGAALSFIFSTGGTNPVRACDAGTFDVRTYYVDSTTGNKYPIDQYTFDSKVDPTTKFTPYIPTASVLDVTVTAGSQVASSKPASFVFTITPTTVITQNSVIQIIGPSQITLQSGSSTVTCTSVVNGKSLLTTVTPSSTSPLTFSLTSVFSTADYTAVGTPLTVTCTNMMNPRSLSATSSFTVSITDINSCPISSLSAGLGVQMTSLPQLKTVSVTTSNVYNGGTSVLTFEVTSDFDLVTGDILYITFPAEISLPSSPVCSPVSQLSLITCTSPTSNKLKAVLKFSTSPLTAGTKLSFKVNSVKNAPSTKKSSDFTPIQMFDTNNNNIGDYKGSSVTVTNLSPAAATGTLDQYNTDVGIATDYTITFTTINAMTSGATFQIGYPSTITPPSSGYQICSVTVNSVAYQMQCSTDSTSRIIKMISGSQSGLVIPVAVGTKVILKVSPITNPQTQNQPGTLTMTSFTDDNQRYSYDKISSGLVPTFKCDYPCATCPSSTQRTTCLSCFTDIISVAEKYLNNSQCLSQCPDGFYDDNFVCKQCPKECKTCKDSKTCITCDTSKTSQFPNYLNNWCYSKCPDSYFADTSFKCQKCNTNCQTCNASATNCTTCNPNSTVPYLSASQCVSRCDAGWVSLNFQCQPCKTPCATCVSTQDSCASCSQGNLLGIKCVDQCPLGFTTDNKICIGCDPRCEQCSPTIATKCIKCLQPLVLFNNTCIAKCPDGYKADSQGINCFLIPPEPVAPVVPPTPQTNNTATPTPPTPPPPATIEVVSSETDELVDPKENTTYSYFSTQIAQTVAGGVAMGAKFKDPSSGWSSNTVGLWGPIEMISIGAQLYLSYDHLTGLQNKSELSLDGNATTSRRRLIGIQEALTSVTNDIVPLVFYGTAFAMVVKLLCNVMFAVFFIFILRQDAGYQEFAQTHKCHPWSVVILSTLFSFKLHKFLYSRFMGLDRFYIPFENPERIHSFFNVLTTMNIILSLVPVVLIDVYGLARYKWGSQFYMMLIETLIFSLSMIVVQVFEYRSHKTFNPYLDDYAQVKDNSEEVEALVRQRLGQALEEYARRLKIQQEGQGEQNIRRTNSMPDIGDRDKEEDPRRLNTEPLDKKRKKIYEDRMNPYHQVLDHDFPDNVYAEPGRNLRSHEGKGIGKVQQTGQRTMTADEYDTDFEARSRMLSAANMRGDQRVYGQFGDSELDDEFPQGYKKRKNMRGRKGKYYSQVDDEDQNFLDQERRLTLGNSGIGEEDDEEDDQQRLGMIEEESQHSSQRKHSTDEEKLLAETKQPPKTSPREQTKQASHRSGGSQKGPSPRDLQNLENQILKETSPRLQAVAEVEKANGIPEEDEGEHSEIETSLKKQVHLHQSEDRDIEEDDIVDEKEVIMNTRMKPKGAAAPENSAKKTEDMRKEIEQISKELEDDGQGQPDSDEEDSKRVENMRDPEKRRFNVNDILGEFDRDERGHPLILQDNQGELIDKQGSRVNEKGYLVDPKTGDILEKERGRKIFNASELDDKGELPPPFNLERYNFNGHDIRGHFDRDPKTGKENLRNLKRDAEGFLLDKLGRRVNEHGWLIDEMGGLTDKRNRTKLHRHIMEQNGGEMPQLFTYKGKKFELSDVLGALDKDRKGNVIIRRDSKGNLVDKLGRPVNGKGYLVDSDGHVINHEGKVMFENYTLSRDGEIPKLFPFLKFNIDEVKGDYEMDPLGNPMLQRTRSGSLIDSKGRKVNDKGYLLDDEGNVVNKRKEKVFSKRLLEEDGEVPKVFRAGLLRKDTYDSFSQLMSEIEDLERLQEMEEGGQPQLDPKTRDKMKRRMEKENERMQQKIDKIVEGGRGGDEDDEGILMKELEELANDNPDAEARRHSDGGNTSVDSMMEDTPSNYNALNQRFMEVEAVKNQAKRNMKTQQQVREDEDDEEFSEYSYLPDMKMRKKKKKKKSKKKRKNDGTIDERELMMAKAYGGLSQSQYDKLVALKKLQASQLPGAARIDTAHLMNRTPSNLNTVIGPPQHRFSRVGNIETMSRVNDDQRSDWGESQGPETRAHIFNQRKQASMAPNQSLSRMKGNQGNSTSRMQVANKPQKLNNNLMGTTTNKSQGPDGSEQSENNANFQGMMKKRMDGQYQQIANVANSVSGFYKDHGPAQSEYSHMSRTQDAFASNLAGNVRERINQDREGQPRIYGTGNRQIRSRGAGQEEGGFGDDLSDWERQSHRSGRSIMSHFSQFNAMKVKGLETIYLQRLEPATKKAKRGLPPAAASEKAKFRGMKARPDEGDWQNEDRDELDSIISGNYKEMQRKFAEEFQGSSNGTKSKKNTKGNQKSASRILSTNIKNMRK